LQAPSICLLVSSKAWFHEMAAMWSGRFGEPFASLS